MEAVKYQWLPGVGEEKMNRQSAESSLGSEAVVCDAVTVGACHALVKTQRTDKTKREL